MARVGMPGNCRRIAFRTPNDSVPPCRFPDLPGGAVGGRPNTGSNANDTDINLERRIGFWSCDRRQRRDHPRSGRQYRKLSRQDCARMRARIVARPGRPLPSVCQEARVPARISPRPFRQAVLAQLIALRGAGLNECGGWATMAQPFYFESHIVRQAHHFENLPRACPPHLIESPSVLTILPHFATSVLK